MQDDYVWESLLIYPNDGQVNVWYVIMQDIEA
jgi:hypothetical protein